MTRHQANEILTLCKSGAQNFHPSIINRALTVTGDIAPTINRTHPVHEKPRTGLCAWGVGELSRKVSALGFDERR